MNKRKIIPTIAILSVMAAIIIDPPKYILSAQNGMILFAMTVLPALFPFFFFSKLLCVFEADVAMGNMLKRPLRCLYNAPSCGGYILTMSLMCGYPIGARLISDYYNDNIINKQESISLSALASTAGPLFILGTIGSIILNNRTAGIIILVSHYLSALINGVVYRNNGKIASSQEPTINPTTLKDSIYMAVISILIVGGYIIVFNIICDVLINTGIIEKLSVFVSPLFSNASEGVLLSIIEVTRGSVIIGKSDVSIISKTATIAAAVTFGGLSIIIQSITFLEKTGIKPLSFIMIKLTQCIIAYVIAYILAIIFMG